MNEAWHDRFQAVWKRGSVAWTAGRRTPATLFNTDDVAFLKTVGCSAQELFDFIEDFHEYGEPDMTTALAVAALRREYFLRVLGGNATGKTVRMESLPAKTAEVDGIAWLPRLIAKARLKLRGEMPADLMYGCAGDRPFLRRMNMDLPGFLKLVAENGADDRHIVDAVKRHAAAARS
ncbi:MAG: DUF5069 domain-containing protein [Pedosphaera sp.]|nr:DUF5069 domain-containing protein [Pedosphaera sp.]